jgi:hypothetical protein
MGTLRQLVTSVRSPRCVLDAAVYVAISAWARVSTGATLRASWERDDSSRL